MPDDSPGSLPEAHPRFAYHFTAPLYESQDAEFAPFGSDEGWDMLMDWADRREELDGAGSVRFVLGDGDVEEGADVVEEFHSRAPGEVDAAVLVVCAGFTLLRLTGAIDREGRDLVLSALDHLQSMYGPGDEIGTMREDLAAFR